MTSSISSQLSRGFLSHAVSSGGVSVSSRLRTKYPAVTYSTNFLEVEPGWRVAYTETGNPAGIPVLFVHGGPGGRFNDNDLCWFDPDKYRIIAFDQRGTGRCEPSPFNSRIPAREYSSITIQTFVSDMEALRTHLHIDRWLVFGGSWGSALSLYYAQEYPEYTHGLVLRGIYLATHAENERFYSSESLTKELGEKWDPESLRAMFEYAEQQGIAVEKNSKGLLEAYYELVLNRNDYKAMHLWSEFEEYVDSPTPEKLHRMLMLPESEDLVTPSIKAHAIFEISFFKNLPDQVNLLDSNRLHKIKDIPLHIVQGEQDTVCPKEVAIKLKENMELVGGSVDWKLIEGGKHSPHSPGMTDALIRITDAFEPIQQS